MSLRLEIDCRKQFDRGVVIAPRGDWTLAPQSVAAVFGPSGGGKTTLLRLLAGLERPDAGRIVVAGQPWCDVTRRLWRPPAERPIGMLAQDYALFPHLSVSDNISFGLRELPKAARRARAAELLGEFDLPGYEERLPGELSGGQQQRVALARALARRPQLLLLDEPLAALDLPTRQALRLRLRRWLRQSPAATLLVTHDPEEALALADTVWVVSGGVIRQTGSVDAVFQRPADAELAGLVGIETVQPARLVSVTDGLARLTVGTAELFALAGGLSPGEAFVCIRAADVLLERDAPAASSARNRLPAQVVSLSPLGSIVSVELDCGFPLRAQVTRAAQAELGLSPGTAVFALIKAPAIHLVGRG